MANDEELSQALSADQKRSLLIAKADGPGSIALLQGFCQISKSRESLATDTEILAKTLSYVLLSKVRLRATSTRPHDRDSGLSRIPRSCITRGL